MLVTRYSTMLLQPNCTMKHALTALLLSPALLLAQPASPERGGSTPHKPAEAPKLTNDQMASIMKQLDAIETQVVKNRGDSLGTALAKFRQAMAGDREAVELYQACYKLEHFDRKDLKQTDFQEWKDKNEERFKDPDFVTGLRLQLEYLTLSIQAQDAKDMAAAVTGLQAFIPKAIVAVQDSMKHSASGAVEEKDKGRPGRPQGGGARQGNAGQGGQLLVQLRQSVKATDFSKAYFLDDFLKLDAWEYAPLGIEGIYTKVILPYYLENKPTELAAQWDARINAELVLNKGVQSETEYQVYYKETQPILNWAKAQYLFSNNINPILAMADMLKIVRDNPTHPNAASWLKQLRDAVAQSQPESISPSATAETPAAAPSGT
jgi:hypothetical protein